MTDNEIIKAFKDFLNEQVDGYTDIVEIGGERYEFIEKELELLKEMDNLINRQKAENEQKDRAFENLIEVARLWKEKYNNAKKELFDKTEQLKTAKAEAYKEFAARLKEKSKQGKGYLGNVYHSVDVAEIDNLLKEMESDN